MRQSLIGQDGDKSIEANDMSRDNIIDYGDFYRNNLAILFIGITFSIIAFVVEISQKYFIYLVTIVLPRLRLTVSLILSKAMFCGRIYCNCSNKEIKIYL